MDEQKTESHQLSEKGCVFSFLDYNKARKREVFSFCAALSALRFTPAEQQNPCMTLSGLALYQSQGGGFAKNWKPVFLLFVTFR